MLTLDERLAQAARDADVRAATAAVLRETFSAGRARAERRLEAGGQGREVARLYAAAADEMLQALWTQATQALWPVSVSYTHLRAHET